MSDLTTFDRLDWWTEDKSREENGDGKARLLQFNKIPNSEFGFFFGCAVGDVCMLCFAGKVLGDCVPGFIGEDSSRGIIACGEGVDGPGPGDCLEAWGILLC